MMQAPLWLGFIWEQCCKGIPFTTNIATRDQWSIYDWHATKAHLVGFPVHEGAD